MKERELFGDLLRRISAIRAREKVESLAVAKIDLPALWIAANIDVLKQAMAAAAQNGQRSLDFDRWAASAGHQRFPFESATLNGRTLGPGPHDELSDPLYKALKKALRAEGITVTRESREMRYQRKPLVYVQWMIKW